MKICNENLIYDKINFNLICDESSDEIFSKTCSNTDSSILKKNFKVMYH